MKSGGYCDIPCGRKYLRVAGLLAAPRKRYRISTCQHTLDHLPPKPSLPCILHANHHEAALAYWRRRQRIEDAQEVARLGRCSCCHVAIDGGGPSEIPHVAQVGGGQRPELLMVEEPGRAAHSWML